MSCDEKGYFYRKRSKLWLVSRNAEVARLQRADTRCPDVGDPGGKMSRQAALNRVRRWLRMGTVRNREGGGDGQGRKMSMV